MDPPKKVNLYELISWFTIDLLVEQVNDISYITDNSLAKDHDIICI